MLQQCLLLRGIRQLKRYVLPLEMQLKVEGEASLYMICGLSYLINHSVGLLLHLYLDCAHHLCHSDHSSSCPKFAAAAV